MKSGDDLGWRLSFKSSAVKELEAIPKIEQVRIKKLLTDMLDDPRSSGKPLKGDKRDLWRYRVGRYRILCDIQDDQLCVLVVRVGHRKDIYE